MERPEHALRANRPHASTPTRIASIVFVGALHVALIYALATGLTARLAAQISHEIQAQVIPPEQPKQQPPAPVEVNLAQPTLPTVQAPQIQIQQPPQPRAITTVVAPPAPAPVVAAPPAPPPPTRASAIGSTHTIPPYPDQARRLSEQGTVRLHIEVASDGSVADATVAQSSGSSTLDEAAVAWVKEHWRYKPATQQGHAVSSSVEAAVVFNLKNAG